MTDLVTPSASHETIALVERYLGAWNEADRDARDALIAATWAKEGDYTDPLLAASGRLGISEMLAAYPDHLFPSPVRWRSTTATFASAGPSPTRTASPS